MLVKTFIVLCKNSKQHMIEIHEDKKGFYFGFSKGLVEERFESELDAFQKACEIIADKDPIEKWQEI